MNDKLWYLKISLYNVGVKEIFNHVHVKFVKN